MLYDFVTAFWVFRCTSNFASLPLSAIQSLLDTRHCSNCLFHLLLESNLHLLSRSPRRLSDPDLLSNSLTALTDNSVEGSGMVNQPVANNPLSTSLTESNTNIDVHSQDAKSRNNSDVSIRQVEATPKPRRQKSLHSSNSRVRYLLHFTDQTACCHSWYKLISVYELCKYFYITGLQYL